MHILRTVSFKLGPAGLSGVTNIGFVCGKPMVNASGQDEQVILVQLHPHPLIILAPHVEIALSSTNVPDLLILVQMFVEEHLDLLLVGVTHLLGRDENLVTILIPALSCQLVNAIKVGKIMIKDAKFSQVINRDCATGVMRQALVALRAQWLRQRAWSTTSNLLPDSPASCRTYTPSFCDDLQRRGLEGSSGCIKRGKPTRSRSFRVPIDDGERFHCAGFCGGAAPPGPAWAGVGLSRTNDLDPDVKSIRIGRVFNQALGLIRVLRVSSLAESSGLASASFQLSSKLMSNLQPASDSRIVLLPPPASFDTSHNIPMRCALRAVFSFPDLLN